jgi:putative iron-regulated protein
MHARRSNWSLLALLCAACSGDEDERAQPTLPENAAGAARTYAQIALAGYEDSLSDVRALDAAIDDLVAAPTDENLEAARDAWRAARETYLQTEVFRFYDGPIDHPETGVEGLVNAWPLDEAYIDYVADDPAAGIVNDAAITIDAAARGSQRGGWRRERRDWLSRDRVPALGSGRERERSR